MNYRRGDRVLISDNGIIEVGILGGKLILGFGYYYFWRSYKQKRSFHGLTRNTDIICRVNPLEPPMYLKKVKL